MPGFGVRLRRRRAAASASVAAADASVARHDDRERERHRAIRDARADDGAEHDRDDRRALDPAVRAHEPVRADELGQDAVLRRPVDGRAGADERVGRHRLDAGEHEAGAGGFEHVADQQHVRLRAAIGERADPRREHDERDEKRGSAVPARTTRRAALRSASQSP